MHWLENRIPPPLVATLFGLLMCVGSLRFMAQGWIERLYVEPMFHFKYWGFEWVQVPGPTGLYLLFGGIAFLLSDHLHTSSGTLTLEYFRDQPLAYPHAFFIDTGDDVVFTMLRSYFINIKGPELLNSPCFILFKI